MRQRPLIDKGVHEDGAPTNIAKKIAKIVSVVSLIKKIGLVNMLY